jgi:hypothetical protein
MPKKRAFFAELAGILLHQRDVGLLQAGKPLCYTASRRVKELHLK